MAHGLLAGLIDIGSGCAENPDGSERKAGGDLARVGGAAPKLVKEQQQDADERRQPG
jgi:hypothetical protein